MPKQSAGILAYRIKAKALQVFLVHPGGPFFAKKDAGAWSIPKGEFDEEEPLAAARREFEEETGTVISGNFIELSPVRLKSGKKIFAFAIECDIDHTKVISNSFELEWPPRSGKMKEFPEIDKAGWFSIEEAEEKINAGQAPLLRELKQIVEKGEK